MITEEQIAKSKFFTTNGADIWRVKAVSTFTQVMLINCETGSTASARVGEKSAGGFVPVIMPKVKNEGRGAREKKKVKAVKVRAGTTEKTGPGVRPGEKPSSQYLGVTVRKTKGGRKRFYAQLYRGDGFKHLGIHNTEEAAAAAVQDHLGNTEEAARLRKLAEAETDREIRKLKEETEVIAWDCRACGAGYKYEPDQCGKCSGRSFVPARPEAND